MKQRLFIPYALATLMLVSGALPIATHAAHEKLSETTDASFAKDVIGNSNPVLVDFYTTWCVPCKILEPTIEKLSKDYAGKVSFYRMDAEKNPETAAKFEVTAFPAIKIFKGGKVVQKCIGVQKEKQLRSMLDKAI